MFQKIQGDLRSMLTNVRSEREVKQMHELDVAEERSRDEVPEGVRIWSGRWCHRKKAGGVRSRYVVRQYHRVVRGCVLWDTRMGSDSSTVGSGISDALEGGARRFLDGVHAHASTGI